MPLLLVSQIQPHTTAHAIMTASRLPPGLSYDEPLVETANGGAEEPWLHYEKVKLYTNAFVIVDDTKVRPRHPLTRVEGLI